MKFTKFLKGDYMTVMLEGTNGMIQSTSVVFKLPKLKEYNIRVQKGERDVVRKKKNPSDLICHNVYIMYTYKAPLASYIIVHVFIAPTVSRRCGAANKSLSQHCLSRCPTAQEAHLRNSTSLSQRHSSALEHCLSMFKALGLIPSTRKYHSS